MTITQTRKHGEGPSYPFCVWSGILEPKHHRRIGPALWEFLWCLDKTTEEVDGIGWVFRKAPVRLQRIAADLGAAEHSVRRHMKALETHGYITRRRTPYGFVIGVLNSRKVRWNGRKENVEADRSDSLETGQNEPVSPAKVASLTGQNGRNKEDKTIDKGNRQDGAQPETQSERSLAFRGSHLEITEKQDRLLGEAFPWIDRQAEYRKMDSWLAANPSRRVKRHSSFAHNWFSRILLSSSKGGFSGRESYASGAIRTDQRPNRQPDYVITEM